MFNPVNLKPSSKCKNECLDPQFWVTQRVFNKNFHSKFETELLEQNNKLQNIIRILPFVPNYVRNLNWKIWRLKIATKNAYLGDE